MQIENWLDSCFCSFSFHVHQCISPLVSVPITCRSCWGNTICGCLRAQSSLWKLTPSSGTQSESKSFHFHPVQFNDHLLIYSVTENINSLLRVPAFVVMTTRLWIMTSCWSNSSSQLRRRRLSRPSRCPQGAHMQDSLALFLAGVTLPWVMRVGG